MTEFDEIRPYRDEEVEQVLKNLLKEKEFFIGLSSFKFPKLTKLFPSLGGKLARFYVKRQINDVKTIAQFQNIISVVIEQMLNKSSKQLTESGIKNLPSNKSYLFISNHRGIAIDPGLIGYLLYKSNRGTFEVAIGDNLLKKKFIADLLRLNKCFIVKRSAKGREKLLALKVLSSYIHHTINDGSSIWLAQNEGRAKDGNDVTAPPIIKMLHMGRSAEEKTLSLKDNLDRLNIVPVAISYEYDPCDVLKAQELYENEHKGGFVKHEKSDQESIAADLTGYKGHINVTFGSVIDIKESDAVHIAEEIDKQIIKNYMLHPSNYLAYEKLREKNQEIGPNLDTLNTDVKILPEDRQYFTDRYTKVSEELKPYFLEMYANPVLNYIKLNN